MKQIIAAALFTSVSTLAIAQTANPPANQNPSTPAVSNKDHNNPGAPAAGANSFTEGQAKSRIEAAGYTNVSGLAKDKDGVWRGKAAKGGATKDVRDALRQIVDGPVPHERHRVRDADGRPHPVDQQELPVRPGGEELRPVLTVAERVPLAQEPRPREIVEPIVLVLALGPLAQCERLEGHGDMIR